MKISIKKIVLAIAIVTACVSPYSAFATQKTKAQLTTEINTQFATNGTGAITAAILRQVVQDMVDSAQQINLLNSQTGTTYTFTAADQGHLVTFNNAAPVAVSLPAATGDFGGGWSVIVQNLGAGTATITTVAGTINGAASLAVTSNQVVLIVSGGLNAYRAVVYGTVNSVTCGTGLSGGTFSTSGTCSITDTISAAGPIGSTSSVPVITFNDRGQLTTVTSATITAGSISAVPTTRIISSGTGLSGGGDLSADRTLSIANTGVASGTYGSGSLIPSITVNAQGQITAITSSSFSNSGVSAGSYGSSSQVGAFTVSAAGLITTASNVTITPAAIGALSLTTQSQAFSGGATTQANVAAAAAGNFTADCGRGPTQYITASTSAWTITAPSSDGSCIVMVTNPASAITPSFSGFTVGSNVGASMTTSNGAKFSIQIWRILGTAAYQIFAHQ